MKKKILAGLAIGLLIFGMGIANATNITVAYNATNFANLSGSFTGGDTNNNGLLEFTELTDWSTSYNGGASFSALNDIGDFNYTANVWIPNAYQWNQSTQDAYMTWNNWHYSASTSNYNWSFTTTISGAPAPVPEPATMVLLGLGLVGLAGIGRKKLQK